jgi:hypothetical protein
MSTILTSIYCIPCVWTLVAVLSIFGVCSYILNIWMPFRGPLPSDGPVEGFASKSARIEFYDTSPLRIRTATKFGIIGAVIWMVGLVTAYLILRSLEGGA